MALRISSNRLTARLVSASGRPSSSVTAIPHARRLASAAAVPTSGLADDVKRELAKESSSVPNPDPPSDSQSACLVQDREAFLVPTYARPPPVFVKGEGSYLYDLENRKYLDFTAGIAVNALGHCDEEMVKLLSQQARTLIHSSNLYHNPWIGELSKLLVEKTLAAGCMATASKVFISNSGSEANEAALKFARKVGKVRSSGSKYEIVSFHNSFHGRTFGSLSATPNPKYQKPFAPMVPGFRYGTLNDEAALSELVTEETCGVIVEPIQGEGGVDVATPSFLAALRKRCHEVGAVLIYDEIQCGLSRTGKLWAHGELPPEAHPDILTSAKALGNGFPIGATIVSEDVAKAIQTGDHGTTFGGNPLACRLAHYIVNRLSEPELQKGVFAKEKIFRKHFDALRKRYPAVVKEVRGKGLLLGLQLAKDPTPLVTAARERGLLIITCGTNTLRFVPPLVISENEIEAGMGILSDAMDFVFKQGQDVEGTKHAAK